MILVDTSAWIEFFGKGDRGKEVDELLELDDAAICGPIFTELRRGLRSPGDRRTVLPLLGGCHALEQPSDLWFDAGDLGFTLARRGVSVKTFDLLIATYSLAHSTPLLTLDRDFRSMRDAGIPLTLV